MEEAQSGFVDALVHLRAIFIFADLMKFQDFPEPNLLISVSNPGIFLWSFGNFYSLHKAFCHGVLLLKLLFSTKPEVFLSNHLL